MIGNSIPSSACSDVICIPFYWDRDGGTVMLRLAISLAHSTRIGLRRRRCVRSSLRQRNELVIARDGAVLLRAPLCFGGFNAITRACDEVPPYETLAVGSCAADQHDRCGT